MRDDEESVVCWGANGSRQLGRSDAGPVGRPVSITVAESPVVRTGGDRRSVFAVTEDGHLFSWGAVSGRIGSLDPDPDPAMLPALSNVTSFAAGPQHACAVTDGDVRCWSSSTAAPLCSGLIESARLPLRAPLPTKGWVVARQVSLSETTTCARLTDGTVHCCGDDSFGQLGLSNDAGHSSSFVRVAATSGRAVQVAAADHTTCLLLAGGEVTCWGSNEYGALGQGTRDDTIREMPVTVRFR
jgi:alpha-tubulin suppressor-like RCC1 family protein